MAELHGKVGALYYAPAYINRVDISFANDNPDEIATQGGNFTTAGFVQNTKIQVSGSTSNDGEYTIDTGGVATGALTLIGGDELTTEVAGDDVFVQTAPQGTQLLGFRDWSIDDGADIHEKTDFEDGNNNYKTRIAALRDWTATANGFFQDDNLYNFAGSTFLFRFFVRNASDPTGTTAYYYEGLGIIENMPVNTPVDELVTQTLNITGTGTLTFVTRTTAWH